MKPGVLGSSYMRTNAANRVNKLMLMVLMKKSLKIWSPIPQDCITCIAKGENVCQSQGQLLSDSVLLLCLYRCD